MRDSAGRHGPMRGRRRGAGFYDRTAYNNRWYRWLALGLCSPGRRRPDCLPLAMNPTTAVAVCA